MRGRDQNVTGVSVGPRDPSRGRHPRHRVRMEVSDDVWFVILCHHGPIDLVSNTATRRAIAATRVQRMWKARHPCRGDIVTVRLKKGVAHRGQVTHVYHAVGRRWCAVKILGPGNPQSVFLVTASGIEGRRLRPGCCEDSGETASHPADRRVSQWRQRERQRKPF